MSTTSTGNGPIYGVFAATGKQGGATARALLDAGVSVRALVRRPDSPEARDLAARGAEIVKADFSEPDTLPPAMEGLEALWFMTTPFGPSGADAEIEQGRVLGNAAVDAGIPHIVFNSVGGAERGSGVPHFESKYRVEQTLNDLAINVTVVRPVFFMDNLAGMAQPGDNGALTVTMPLPDGIPLQMISVSDIGVVAATAMRDPDSIPGGTVEIAGDELTGSQIARRMEEATGRTVAYSAIPVSAVQDQEEMYTMFKWFADTEAYQADVETTRRLNPDLHDLGQWISETNQFTQQ